MLFFFLLIFMFLPLLSVFSFSLSRSRFFSVVFILFVGRWNSVDMSFYLENAACPPPSVLKTNVFKGDGRLFIVSRNTAQKVGNQAAQGIIGEFVFVVNLEPEQLLHLAQVGGAINDKGVSSIWEISSSSWSYSS